jgi:hypothetical protein
MVVITKSTKTAAELSTERMMKHRQSFIHDSRTRRTHRASAGTPHRVVMSAASFFAPAAHPRSARFAAQRRSTYRSSAECDDEDL